MSPEVKNDVTASEMVETTDHALLQAFVAEGSDKAFAELIGRHLNWVHLAALRQTRDHATAQDVTQAVFIILARRAGSIKKETVLAGWLFRTVQYAVRDAAKIQRRRLRREQEAAMMQSIDRIDDEDGRWQEIAPVLDEALEKLPERDRNAVLLRFFEKKSFGEIAGELGGNENSARVRVVRAVEKLRGIFRKRGVQLSAAALGMALGESAAQAAPTGLGPSVLANGALLGKVSSTTSAIVRAALSRALWRVILVRLLCAGVLIGAASGIALARLKRDASQAPDYAAVEQAVIALDSAFSFNDPDAFAAMVHTRDEGERLYLPALADYVRESARFRQEARTRLNASELAYSVTFQELFAGQPQMTDKISTAYAQTNAAGRFPIRLIKVGREWKWDCFGGWTPEFREERRAGMLQKTKVLSSLSQGIREGSLTDLQEILQTFERARP